MKISVVIASYNRPALVAEAMDSSLAQDVADFEVVVVDDGSAADTRDFLVERARTDDRIKLILAEHRGIAAARNRGVEESRGELICVLDSDDLLEPGALERIRAHFTAEPSTDLLYGSIRKLHDDGATLVRAYRRFPSAASMVRATLRNPQVPFKHSGTTFKRTALIEAGGYDEALTLKVDVELYLRFLSTGKRVEFIGGAPLATFRVHDGSASIRRVDGLRVWMSLIDRYGPRVPAARAGVKAIRASAEIAKMIVEARFGARRMSKRARPLVRSV
jgi:glycosyltransferase involved in cell wall biosynthesis